MTEISGDDMPELNNDPPLNDPPLDEIQDDENDTKVLTNEELEELTEFDEDDAESNDYGPSDDCLNDIEQELEGQGLRQTGDFFVNDDGEFVTDQIGKKVDRMTKG